MVKLVDGLLGRFAYYFLYWPLRWIGRIFAILSILSMTLGFWFIRPWVKFVTLNKDGSFTNVE